MVMTLSFLEKNKFPLTRKNYNWKSVGFHKKGQLKIQQMSFMIIAVFFFFVLVGLFFVSYYAKSIRSGAARLEEEQAIASLQTLMDMPELNYYGTGYEILSLDEDKLLVMSAQDYGELWPVVSIGVYKVYPAFEEKIKCPAQNCNYYEVYNSEQGDIRTYSSFVSICKKERMGYVYDRCEIGKLVVGVRDVE